jgi:hypothetical protein
MAAPGDGHTKTVDPAAEVDRLRARIKELEDQVRSGDTPDGPPRRSAAGGGMKILTAALAATTALMAAPAFITVRRWIRWWL